MKPDMRRSLADQSFEQKIRKVGELIRLRQKTKTDVSEEAALLASLDKARKAQKFTPKPDLVGREVLPRSGKLQAGHKFDELAGAYSIEP